jgi:hypothetical protein
MSEGWRRGRDSNPWKPFDFNGFQDRRLQPLGHLSMAGCPCQSTAGENDQFTTGGGITWQ